MDNLGAQIAADVARIYNIHGDTALSHRLVSYPYDRVACPIQHFLETLRRLALGIRVMGNFTVMTRSGAPLYIGSFPIAILASDVY